jgi:RHS repeat-associated protein
MNQIQASIRQNIQAMLGQSRMGFIPLFTFSILLAVIFVTKAYAGAGNFGPTIQHGTTNFLKLPTSAQTHSQGATATLLPTGKWLLLGGKNNSWQSTVGDARLYDSKTRKITKLASGLIVARAYHTATLLPDGRVLVIGGAGSTGSALISSEIFDPILDTSTNLQLELDARNHHRATLMVDGQVLVSGGIDSKGKVLTDITLINPLTTSVISKAAQLNVGRFDHLSTLLPNHNVLIWGGVGNDGLSVKQAEIYQLGSNQSQIIDAVAAAQLLAQLNDPKSPTLVDSVPTNGSDSVDISQVLSIRFSKPLDVTSVNTQTLVLLGPSGPISSFVTPTEGGLVVFVVAKQELMPGADYTLVIQGVVDYSGQPLDFTSIAFKTAALNTGSIPLPGGTVSTDVLSDYGAVIKSSGVVISDLKGAANSTNATATSPNLPASMQLVAGASTKNKIDAGDDETWIPGSQHRQGNWRSGRPLLASATDLLDNDPTMRLKIKAMRARLPQESQKAAFTQSNAALANITGVAGTVLRLNDKPLANVTLSIGNKSTQTDSQGRFALTGISPGHYELEIDGSTANNPNHEYLTFMLGVDIHSGGVTELSHYLYMSRIRSGDWVDLPSPTPIASVVTHPSMPGLEIHIPKGTVFRDRQGKVVSRIAVVPVPLDRAPFPTPAAFPTYFMIHPGGAIVQGVSPEASQGISIVYPNNTQSAPGTRHYLWAYNPNSKGWMVYGRATVSADGLKVIPDPGVGLVQNMSGGHAPPSGSPGPQPATPTQPCPAADPVDCASGLFFHQRTDVFLPDDIPISLQRTYRPDSTPSPLVRPFGIGTNHTYGMYLLAPKADFSEFDLILPDGRQYKFPLISGTSDATFKWSYTATPGPFYGAHIEGITDVYWTLHLLGGTTYVFSAIGQLIEIYDRYNNVLNFTYNGGQLLRITSNNGRTLDFTYDASNRITQLKDLLGRIWTYTYNPGGYLQKATYPDGTFESYTYDSAGRMLTVIDRRGNTMASNVYDANGRVSKQTLADGAIFKFAYILDANGNVTQTDVTDPRGNIERKQFNPMGYLTNLTKAVGKPEQQVYTNVRNTANFVTQETDALGRVNQYQYDSYGNRTKVTKLLGTANSVTWAFAYEPGFQQLQSITDPLGHVTTLSYDTKGNVTRIQDPLGNKVDMTYDGSGRVVTTTRYNGITQLTTTYGYDYSDLVSVTDPLNRQVQLFPDAVGRTINTKDPLARFTHIDYDAMNRTVKTTDARGKSISLTYDGNGNALTFTDANNHVTSFSYDVRNRLTIKKDALLKTESYAYDLNSNPTFFTDRRGLVTGAQYDGIDRLIHTGFGATSTIAPVYTSTIDYFYDAADRLTQAIDSANGAINRSYDNRFDTVLNETTPQGTVDYTFTADGQRQSMIPSGGSEVTYNYDAAHRLTQISQAAGLGGAMPATAQAVGFTYDTANRPTTVTLPNGITMNYAYDAASQLSSITYKKADATVIGNLTYTYNAIGNRISTGGTFARTGLPAAISSNVFDVNNKLTKRDTVTYSYDNNGNLTNDGSRTYTWNARDQLVSIAGADTASYSYDAFGRRRSATINGQITATLYDRWNPIQLQAGGLAVENRLLGLGLDNNFARTRSGVTESFLTDALGSTLELRNAVQVQVVQYTYDPYGGTSSSAASTNVIKFTGREQDIGDMYYYRNRYLKPSVGRFISEDPIGLAGGVNTYGYVGQNPVWATDPDGRFWWIAVPVGTIAIIHWTRNYWNEPVSFADAQKSWQELSPDQSIYHRMGPGNEGNRKFVSPNGGNSEAVFTGSGCPVTDPTNMATYNFFGPNVGYGIPHAVTDVLPYFVFGNTPGDMFTTDRFTTTWGVIFGSAPSTSNMTPVQQQ